MAQPTKIVTEPIAVSVVFGFTVEIAHGLGRELAGFLVIWADHNASVWVDDPDASTAETLILRAGSTGDIKLVLLA
jgi:hypothetical protein